MINTRIAKIEEILYENRYINLQNLAREFNVSESTIRRDLQKMEKEGILNRNHGGAIVNSNTVKNATKIILPANISNKEEKMLIGKKASEAVCDGDIIAIGTGTTCLQFSRFLHNKKNLTVVTNNMFVAVELSSLDSFKIICTGGILSYKNCSLNVIGSHSLDFLRNFYVDKLFCSVLGINFKMGYSDHGLDLADSWRAMQDISKRSYLLAESSKFNTHGYISIGKLDCIDEVYTTENIPLPYVQFYEAHEVAVHICKKN